MPKRTENRYETNAESRTSRANGKKRPRGSVLKGEVIVKRAFGRKIARKLPHVRLCRQFTNALVRGCVPTRFVEAQKNA